MSDPFAPERLPPDGHEAPKRDHMRNPKGHLAGYGGHVPGMTDFGAGTSYSRYTAAYLENREEAGDGTLIKTQPMKPAIIERGTQDVLAFKATNKTLHPGYNSLPSDKRNHTTTGTDMGDHTGISVKHGFADVFTEGHATVLAELEKTRILRNNIPIAGYTGFLP